MGAETALWSALGSSPAAIILYLWVRSLNAQVESKDGTITKLQDKIVEMAEKAAEDTALVRDRLKRIEFALRIRKGTSGEHEAVR
jgi:hypothetical protein